MTLCFRGHTVKAVTESFKMSKDAGFKVVTHMMPDLPNVGLERDIEQFIVSALSCKSLILMPCVCTLAVCYAVMVIFTHYVNSSENSVCIYAVFVTVVADECLLSFSINQSKDQNAQTFVCNCHLMPELTLYTAVITSPEYHLVLKTSSFFFCFFSVPHLLAVKWFWGSSKLKYAIKKLMICGNDKLLSCLVLVVGTVWKSRFSTRRTQAVSNTGDPWHRYQNCLLLMWWYLSLISNWCWQRQVLWLASPLQSVRVLCDLNWMRSACRR